MEFDRRAARRQLGRLICAVLGHEPLLTEPGERRLDGLDHPPGHVTYGAPCRYCGRLLWNLNAFQRRLGTVDDRIGEMYYPTVGEVLGQWRVWS